MTSREAWFGLRLVPCDWILKRQAYGIKKLIAPSQHGQVFQVVVENTKGFVEKSNDSSSRVFWIACVVNRGLGLVLVPSKIRRTPQIERKRGRMRVVIDRFHNNLSVQRSRGEEDASLGSLPESSTRKRKRVTLRLISRRQKGHTELFSEELLCRSFRLFLLRLKVPAKRFQEMFKHY